jgi:hydroxypyruvate isomerase
MIACNRRRFVMAGAAAAAAATLPFPVAAKSPRFNLNYAPHPGTFKASAGDDIVAQLEFAAVAGFTAW